MIGKSREEVPRRARRFAWRSLVMALFVALDLKSEQFGMPRGRFPDGSGAFSVFGICTMGRARFELASADAMGEGSAVFR